MIKKVEKTSIKKLTSYVIIGVTAFLTEFIVFIIVYEYAAGLLIAQSTSFLSGLLVSFFGNRNITFANNSTYTLGVRRQIVGYIVLAFINLLLTNVFIYLLVSSGAFEVLFAKFAVMATVIAWNYLIFNKYIFKSA
jgi:putative flippase GtrA